MKLRLAAIGLIVVGVGAVVLAIVGPNLFKKSDTKYITSQATVGTVTASSVANGTVAASTVYGLKFGARPDIVSSTSTTSGTGGTTSSSTGASSGSSSSVIWPVKTVTVKVGQKVKTGDVLAVADDSAAQLALESAQASLASAQARLASDQKGPDAVTIAQAKNQVSQASNSLSQASANKKLTNQQNALTLSQAKAAVTSAQSQLDADIAASAPPATIAQDQATLSKVQSDLATTQLKVDQSNQQAAQQVTNAQLSLASAKLQYSTKIAPTSTATILADRAQVASAQATVDSAQAAVTQATILAPADGLIVAVNILPDVNAPSGYAIQESIGPMVATASFSESAITSLKTGMVATVTVKAAGVDVTGTLSQIVPSASTSGGATSVVTYAVTVTLTDPPETVFAGMTATVSVTTASVDNVLRVPSTALKGSSAAGYSVEILSGDGSVHSQTIQVGLVTSSMAEVTSGISAGDKVVVGTTSSRTGTSNGGGGVNLGGLTGGNVPGGLGR